MGANLGFYSVLASLWNPALHVIAFEPAPAIYSALLRNLRANKAGNASAYKLALSDKTETASFYLPKSEGRDCETTGTLASESWQTRKQSPVVEVECTRFDDFEASHPFKTDLVKIDVEDFEAAVLAGMEAVIRRNRPFIVCEILSRQHGNESTRAIL